MLTRKNIAEAVEAISMVQNQRTLVNDSIQIALDRVYQAHDWPYYLQEASIRTVADYTTGTVAIAQDATTATVTTGVVAATWVGRKVRFQSSTPYYRIASVNTGANTFTLEQAYQGTTLTAGTYAVFKDEYRLGADVDKYKLMRQIENGVPMLSLTPFRFDSIHPAPNSYSDPVYEVMVGTKLDTYTTGTVTCTGTTITGVGTAWTTPEGIGRMNKIRIGNNVYTIKSLDSATQITTYETTTTVAVATTYEITLNNMLVQLYHIPSDARLIYYRYFRQPAILANDYDLPDMPHDFHWVLIYGALSLIFMSKGDIQKSQIEAENRFIDGINMMRLKIGSFAPNRVNQRRPSDIGRLNQDGLETSNFDRRYSS